MSTVPDMVSDSSATLDAFLDRHLHWPHDGAQLVDAERFVEEVEKPYRALVAAEAWVKDYYDAHAAVEFITEGDPQSAYVYEFDLGEETYVALEEKYEVVIVSQQGMVVVPKTETLRKLIAAPSKEPVNAQGKGPRAVFVTEGGEAKPADVAALVAALRNLQGKEKALPKTSRPELRLSRFAPTRHALTPERAELGLAAEGLVVPKRVPEIKDAAPKDERPLQVIVRPAELEKRGSVAPAEGPAERGTAGGGALRFWSELLSRLGRQVTTTATEYYVKTGIVAHEVGRGEELLTLKQGAGTVVVRKP